MAGRFYEGFKVESWFRNFFDSVTGYFNRVVVYINDAAALIDKGKARRERQGGKVEALRGPRKPRPLI